MDPTKYKEKNTVKTYDVNRFEKVAWHRKIYNYLEVGFITSNLKWGSTLDVACGTGRLAFIDNYKGIDFSEEMIKEASKKYPSKSFKLGDARNLPFKDNSFDNVVALRLILHLKDWKKVLSEMRRVCKPGGRIIFDVRFKGLLSFKPKKHKLNLITKRDLPEYKKLFCYPPIFPTAGFVVVEK